GAAGSSATDTGPGGRRGGDWCSSSAVGARGWALSRETPPAATVVAFLTNPKDPELTRQLPAVQDGARALGLRLIVANAATPSEIDVAYDGRVKQGADAVFVASGPIFVNQRAQLVALAARHALPCAYSAREAVVAGGLMSYGNDLKDAYRRNGLYVARILRGDKPGDLPIDAATKFELVINLKTAKALGLNIPETFLARADEVIESRREFITLLGGAAASWPLAARAQESTRLPKIGLLGTGTPAVRGQWIAAFMQRMRELGWIEGRSVAFELRWAEARSERFTEIATEFLQ